jgi:hypothetical protein
VKGLTALFDCSYSPPKIMGRGLMIADGLFERFPGDAVFGMHNMPCLQRGKQTAKVAGIARDLFGMKNVAYPGRITWAKISPSCFRRNKSVVARERRHAGSPSSICIR